MNCPCCLMIIKNTSAVFFLSLHSDFIIIHNLFKNHSFEILVNVLRSFPGPLKPSKMKVYQQIETNTFR